MRGGRLRRPRGKDGAGAVGAQTGYFVGREWAWAFVAVPTYWPARLYLTLLEGGAALGPLAGSLLRLLQRRLRR